MEHGGHGIGARQALAGFLSSDVCYVMAVDDNVF